MQDLSPETAAFIAELDTAVEAHMNWTRRILRCAVLRTPPGEDVLAPKAHTLCRFGCWFAAQRAHFEALDAAATQHIETVHQAMHDAIRTICSDILDGRAGQPAVLDRFEQSQTELLNLLAALKTRIISGAVRHDPLTGLPLRYGIEHDFALYQKETRRNGSLLYVAMIDLDHFKQVNDRYGHPAGDVVLRQIAHTLLHVVRGNEPLYRYGGEEFLWLLQCHTPAEAEHSARRIVSILRATPIPIDDNETLKITATLGLARARVDEDLASAIKRADAALYAGKAAGRDRYVFAPD